MCIQKTVLHLSQQNETITLKTNIMKTLIISAALILVSLTSFGQNKKCVNDLTRGQKIVSIEMNVTCGKTGKTGMYIYFKAKNTHGFNPLKDRKLVLNQSVSSLKNTIEYQDYLRSI